MKAWSNLKNVLQGNLKTDRARECRVYLLGTKHVGTFMGLIGVLACPKKLWTCCWIVWFWHFMVNFHTQHTHTHTHTHTHRLFFHNVLIIDNCTDICLIKEIVFALPDFWRLYEWVLFVFVCKIFKWNKKLTVVKLFKESFVTWEIRAKSESEYCLREVLESFI